VFTDTFWDRADGLSSRIPGTVQGSERPYFGPIPDDKLEDRVGSDDEWVDGLLYSEYLAGKVLPPGRCWPLRPGPRALYQPDSTILNEPTMEG